MSKHTLSAYRQGYLDLWAVAKVTKVKEATLAAGKIRACAARYKALERTTGVPDEARFHQPSKGERLAEQINARRSCHCLLY